MKHDEHLTHTISKKIPMFGIRSEKYKNKFAREKLQKLIELGIKMKFQTLFLLGLTAALASGNLFSTEWIFSYIINFCR